MSIVLQVFAGIALAIGVLVVANNWSTLVRRSPGGFNAPIPLIGGVALALGLLGFEPTRPFWWAGFAADLGTLTLPFALLAMIREARAKGPLRVVHQLLSETPTRRDEIKLCKGAICTLRSEFNPPGRQTKWEGNPVVTRSRTGAWRAEGRTFVLHDFEGARILRIEREGESYRTVEAGFSSEDEMDRLEGLLLRSVAGDSP